MARSLRRPSVPRLNNCFPWSSKKDFNYAGVIEEIDARALENPDWRKDITNVALAQDKANVALENTHPAPSHSTHELAVFLRTTGSRGRESQRAPDSARRRSKSHPRRLLGQLCEYWKPTPDDDALPMSAPYKYDERSHVWVRGSPVDTAQQSLPPVSDSIVERTTSKGHKYFELKGPPSTRADGVFSRGDDRLGKPMAVELDRLILRDITSDELMDGWLADIGGKVDSCSDSNHQSSPPWPTASAAGVRLPLLPPTMADDSIAASRTLARTRASSTSGGRAAIWTPTALLRDSTSTVVRHTVVSRGSHESDENTHLITNDHRASLRELEDASMHDVDDAPTPKMANDSHRVEGGSHTWQTPPQSPGSLSPGWTQDVSLDRDQSFTVSQTETGHTFYTSEELNLVAHVNSRARETRDTVPASSRNVVHSGSYRSNSHNELAHRGSTNTKHVLPLQICKASDQSLGQRRPQGSAPPVCSIEATYRHLPSPTRYIAPKYSPETRDFFMKEIEGDVARLSHTTRSALLYAKTSDCVFCGPQVHRAGFISGSPDDHDHETSRSSASTDTTRTSDHPGRSHAASPVPFRYRPTGPFSSEVDLTDAQRSRIPAKRPRHVQSAELLGRTSSSAWNQTNPLPRAPKSTDKKMAHISTLSRSTSSLHSQKTRRAKYADTGPRFERLNVGFVFLANTFKNIQLPSLSGLVVPASRGSQRITIIR
ncbi:hypothetical protein LTS10_013143 [Elasticomyces elasticus]|nr:hypothetical protein LTS10_013143 [Elasticomyces elasticus]